MRKESKCEEAKCEECFEDLDGGSGVALSDEDQDTRRVVLSGLYNLVDEDGDGTVDLMELVSGLTILCGDSQDEKAEASFRLYDYNGNGVISLEEMTGYLTSVFKIMYHVKEGTAEHMGVSAKTLAAAKAQGAFSEAELKDGMLTFDEFKLWYLHAAAESVAAKAGGGFKASGNGESESSFKKDEDYSNKDDADWGTSEDKHEATKLG